MPQRQVEADLGRLQSYVEECDRGAAGSTPPSCSSSQPAAGYRSRSSIQAPLKLSIGGDVGPLAPPGALG